MKLTLADPRYLKDSISIISELVNEGRFKVTKEGLELIAMDPANVAMVIYKLLSSNFTEYNIKKDMDLVINLNSLKQILKRVSANDMLTLELDENNKLKIQLKGTSVRTFNLPLIDVEEKEQRIPDLKFPVSVKTRSSILNEAIEDADIVGESVTFDVENKKFVITAEGDLSKASIEINPSDATKINVEGSSKVKAKYSIEYLKKMIGGSKLADEVTLYFNKDYPLKIEYKDIDKLMLSFILAPRVEND